MVPLFIYNNSFKYIQEINFGVKVFKKIDIPWYI